MHGVLNAANFAYDAAPERLNMTPQNDLEKTLVAPRFDAAEAETARPVEPLSEVQTPHGTNARRFWYEQRRLLRRAWPLALIACLLSAGLVVGATALIRHRQHAQQALTPQPTPAPLALPTNQPAHVASSAPAPVHTERTEPASRTERSEPPTTHKSAPAAPSALERVAASVAEMARTDRDAPDDARDSDRSEHKKAHKHGKRGDDDEDGASRPHDKKHGRRGGARLFDVITGPDH
jgi:hypothetical protein